VQLVFDQGFPFLDGHQDTEAPERKDGLKMSKKALAMLVVLVAGIACAPLVQADTTTEWMVDLPRRALSRLLSSVSSRPSLRGSEAHLNRDETTARRAPQQ
jgi:hypothetical protein